MARPLSIIANRHDSGYRAPTMVNITEGKKEGEGKRENNPRPPVTRSRCDGRAGHSPIPTSQAPSLLEEEGEKERKEGVAVVDPRGPFALLPWHRRLYLPTVHRTCRHKKKRNGERGKVPRTV